MAAKGGVIDATLVVEPGRVGIEGDREWPELGERSCQGLLVLIVARGLGLGAGRNGVVVVKHILMEGYFGKSRRELVSFSVI